MTLRICPSCGKTYEADPDRLKWSRQTTCSRACSYKYRASKLQARETLTCAVCGKTFERSPSQIKSKHNAVYCSPDCQYAGRTRGLTRRIVTKPYNIVAVYDHKEASRKAWETRRKLGNSAHSPETRAVLRHKTAEAIASGKFPRVSKIERLVASELTAMGVSAIPQYGLRSPVTGRYLACVDFYLPEHHAALEVNGTFWHADPRVYDRSNLAPAQQRTLERYAAKCEALRCQGIRLIEVWEQDLKRDPAAAVRHAFALLP